ncbi:MAG: DUF924 family protein [Pseudomonadota bacterium]
MTDVITDQDRERIEKVLAVWFPDKEYNAPQIDARMELWFGDDAELDARLRYEFADDINEASDGQLFRWADDPRGRLALILLLDQFRRNVYRGSVKAFSHDKMALRLSVEGIVKGLDKELEPIERLFFYMPLQHAESLRVQEKSVEVFQALGRSVSPTLEQTFETFTQFAELHRDIVAQFGRFPHRNAALGRKNTAEEASYLDDGAPNFGQASG